MSECCTNGTAVNRCKDCPLGPTPRPAYNSVMSPEGISEIAALKRKQNMHADDPLGEGAIKNESPDTDHMIYEGYGAAWLGVDFETFEKQLLGKICETLGMTYEQITGDFFHRGGVVKGPVAFPLVGGGSIGFPSVTIENRAQAESRLHREQRTIVVDYAPKFDLGIEDKLIADIVRLKRSMESHGGWGDD